MSDLGELLELSERGFHLFPVDHPELEQCVGRHARGQAARDCVDRGKHPCVRFSHDATTDAEQIAAWFTGAPRNVGIACGASGLLVVDEDTLDDFAKFAASLGQEAPPTFTVATGRGRHYYFRADTDSAAALGNGEGALKAYGVNIRGRGGYVVGPGSVHVTGALYEVLDSTAPAPAPDWLLEALSTTPADDGAFAGIVGRPRGLEGVPEVIRGPHDGAPGERHATLVAYACSLRSRNVPESEAAQLFGTVWARCEQPPACDTALSWDDARGKLADCYDRYSVSEAYRSVHGTADESAGAGDQEPNEDATWGRVDLTDIVNGTWVRAEPSLFTRTDGESLLYPGLVHSFHGESESGKSLIVQLEAVRHINAGDDVLFIDFESDAESIVQRLLDFGANPAAVAGHFDYRHPEVSPQQGAAEHQAWVEMLGQSYTLAIIDGVTDSLGVFGLATKDNDDVSTWMRRVPKRIATRTGAAVVIIDHVTKDADSRGRFAIGGQAKMSALTGAAYTVEIVEVLGRGLRGVVGVRVGKDRPGAVRPHCGAFRRTDRTQEAARVVIDSTVPDRPRWEIDPPRSGTDAGATKPDFRPTSLMEKVSGFLEAAGDPQSFNSINGGVTGKEGAIREAVGRLESEGFIAIADGPNRARLHTSIAAYRQAADPRSDRYEPEGDTWVSEVVSPVSRPYTGGRETPPECLSGDTGRHSGDTGENGPSELPLERPESSANAEHKSCERCGRRLLLKNGRSVCERCRLDNRAGTGPPACRICGVTLSTAELGRGCTTHPECNHQEDR